MDEKEKDDKLAKMADIVLDVRNKNAELEAALRAANRNIQRLADQNKILEQTLNAATQENQGLKTTIESITRDRPAS